MSVPVGKLMRRSATISRISDPHDPGNPGTHGKEGWGKAVNLLSYGETEALDRHLANKASYASVYWTNSQQHDI